MKKFIVTFISLLMITLAAAQTPEQFKYQAVLRDADGNVMTDKNVTVDITILEGSATGPGVFSESHNVTTNSRGLINLNIGSSDDLNAVDWGSGKYFIEIAVNGTVMGTNQLLSVPYALYAETAGNISGDIQETDPVFDASAAGTISESDINNWNNKLDAEKDGSLTNELQMLSLSNDTLYLSDGNFVELPVGFTGSYQDLTGVPINMDTDSTDDFGGDWSDLSGIPSDLADGDNVGIKTINTNPRISGNGNGTNPLDLARQGATSGQVLKWDGSAWSPASGVDNDWNRSGSGKISTANISDSVGIGTTDPAAWLEVNYPGGAGGPGMLLSTTNHTALDLKSKATEGNTYRLQSSKDGSFQLWKQQGEHIMTVDTNKFFGIGTQEPDYKMEISASGQKNNAVFVVNNQNGSLFPGPAFETYGIWGSASSDDTERKYGIIGHAIGNQGDCYGIKGEAKGTEKNYGVYGYAENGMQNYGVYGTAGTGRLGNWAGYFEGDVHITGNLSKGSGSFLIDHPQDPENKILRHNFVESPENLCLYRGKVKLDADGKGIVTMPDYFVALTDETDASIHLTPEGRPFMTGAEWNKGFTAFTVYGKPNRKVYYTVYADRDDPVIHKLSRPVVEEKGKGRFKKGTLLYPEAFGYPKSKGSGFQRSKNIRKSKDK